jgi:hypothetical protein
VEQQYALNPEEMKKAKAYTKMLQNMKNVKPRRKSSDKISNKPTGSLLSSSTAASKGEDKKKKV